MLIPFYRSQIEISKEQTDLANARTAYAGLMEAVKKSDPKHKEEDGSYTAMVTKMVQKYDGWEMNTDGVEIGGVPASEWIGEPVTDGKCILNYNTKNQKLTVVWGHGR